MVEKTPKTSTLTGSTSVSQHDWFLSDSCGAWWRSRSCGGQDGRSCTTGSVRVIHGRSTSTATWLDVVVSEIIIIKKNKLYTENIRTNRITPKCSEV